MTNKNESITSGQKDRIAQLVIDQLVQLDDGCWWVLDYKLTSDPAADASLREQLARYRAAVRQLVSSDEPVRAAFVTAAGALQELAESARPE